jgi:hypothetical protein
MEADPALLSDVVAAIRTTLDRYNTTVWENRFIVGGVVEQIIGASARALGLAVDNAGKMNQGYDLRISPFPEIGISIKGVFASVNGKHNLVNVRGDGNRVDLSERWTRATIFVMSGVGIGYVDPKFGQDLVSASGDAVQISGSGLRAWWASTQGEWIIAARIPAKPAAGPTIRVASDPVSLDVLQGFPRLSPHWRAEV